MGFRTCKNTSDDGICNITNKRCKYPSEQYNCDLYEPVMKPKNERLSELRIWLESTFSSEELSQHIITDILKKIDKEFK